MNITHSYSATGNPYDNSVCEAFFKTLKEEELYRHEYHSEAEMKKSVSDYIERYNSKPISYIFYIIKHRTGWKKRVPRKQKGTEK